MKKNYKTKLILFFLITLLTLFLVNSKLIIESILTYTELFITKLFPTNFLIYIIASLLINYQIIESLSKITKNPASLFVIIMSMICGFPSGPKHIKELLEKKYLSWGTCNYLLRFTHFPNPLFILGSVSTILTKTIALKLLIALILSNFLIAILTYKKSPSTSLPQTKQLNFSTAIAKAITSSFKLQLLIYGTNLFFFLIATLLITYFKTTPLIFILINGFFDLIKGIYSVTLLSSPLIKAILIIIFISLGSISINIQIKSILTDTSLSYKSFLQGRFISTFFAITIFLLIYPI